jgi:hypothetical protein
MFRENKSHFKLLDVFSIIFDFLEIFFLRTEKYSTSKHDLNVSRIPPAKYQKANTGNKTTC